MSQESQPVAVALIEAKKDTLPPGHGLDQAKGYLAASRHNVLFVFSSNGYQFVEFDRTTGMTTMPRPMSEFPSPADLRARYERIMGFSLEAQAAKPDRSLESGLPGNRLHQGVIAHRLAANASSGDCNEMSESSPGDSPVGLSYSYFGY